MRIEGNVNNNSSRFISTQSYPNVSCHLQIRVVEVGKLQSPLHSLNCLVNSSLNPASQPAKPGKVTQTIGFLAEDLVAQWLIGQGWEILQRRWHCRWGELDLVARGAIASIPKTTSKNAPLQSQPVLAFVEVKARGRGNWDANGLLAITPKKQAKLWQAAQLFLAEQPELAELPCRFDVALVSYGRSPLPISKQANSTAAEDSTITIPQQTSPIISRPVKLGQPLVVSGYRLILQQYIQSAFD